LANDSAVLRETKRALDEAGYQPQSLPPELLSLHLGSGKLPDVVVLIPTADAPADRTAWNRIREQRLLAETPLLLLADGSTAAALDVPVDGLISPSAGGYAVVEKLRELDPAFRSQRILRRQLDDMRRIAESNLPEDEQRLTHAFLELINASSDRAQLMQGVAELLQNWSGCEAVGIRLREGEDFPYFVTSGFPQAFVRAERWLCARDEAGAILRDAAGNAVLDCMCGNIICGRFDPAKDFFTPRGSFWTNSTTRLLASTTDADRQARTRNRCNGEGYESVALIRMKAGAETFGLIQLNDKRPGRFTAEGIALLERVADYLAIAMARWQAERQAQRSETRFRRIVETAGEGIWVMNRDYRTAFVNSRMAEMLGVTASEMVGTRVEDFMFEEDVALASDWIETIRGESFDSHEQRFRCRDGRMLWTSVSAAALLDADGEFDGFFSMITDITRRKQAEQALLASLEEKTALLKEVHHRVKNNLQIVISLLSLQADRAKNPELLDSLRDSRNRIRSMAVLHEMLYRSESLAWVKMPDYIDALCAHLARAAGVNARVRMVQEVGPQSFSMDLAVPCGLILNELVSNSLKHAFPGGRSGVIRVSMVKSERGGYLLTVADDGVGLPAGIDPETAESIGLKLVRLLAGQLQGEVEVRREAGTEFRIAFPGDVESGVRQ